jgi:co-chaperonin GroES (HSP10)
MSEKLWLPLRGRVVLREIKSLSSIILHVVESDPYKETTHRGVVLALGSPPWSNDGTREIPWQFEVGDTVGFHFVGTEKGRTNKWIDGEDALFLAAWEIDWTDDAGSKDEDGLTPSDDAYYCNKCRNGIDHSSGECDV